MIYGLYLCDSSLTDHLLYDPSNPDLQVISPRLTLEVNAAGALQVTIPPSNAYYDSLTPYTELYVVHMATDRCIFRGRIADVREDLYRRRTIYCEGALAYLQDTLVSTSYSGSCADIIAAMLRKHNTNAGNVRRMFKGADVVAPSASDSYTIDGDYSTTLEAMQDAFFDVLGGYYWVTYDASGPSSAVAARPVLKYRTVFDGQAEQPIRFGQNLLSYAKTLDYSGIATVCIAEGDNGLTTTYEYSAAVSTYGKIYTHQSFPGLTTTAALRAAALEYLQSTQWDRLQLQVTAADLSALDASLDPWQLGEQVRVVSAPHGIDAWYPVAKIDMALDSAKAVYTLGQPDKGRPRTLTEHTTETEAETEDYIDTTVAEAIAGGGGSGGGLPSGGTPGAALTKRSSTDYDVTWSELATVPAGGTNGQVLTKTLYSYGWKTPASGGTTYSVAVFPSDVDTSDAAYRIAKDTADVILLVDPKSNIDDREIEGDFITDGTGA